MEADRLADPAHPGAADGRGPGGKQGRPRFQALRNYARGLSYLGVAFGWVFVVVSLTPSLLPRSWLVQGLVSGTALAQGYGLGVVVAWVARHARIPRAGAGARRQAWYALAVLILATIVPVIVLSSRWGAHASAAAGTPATNLYQYLGVFLVAVGLAAGVIGVARLVHDVYLVLAGRLRRHLPGAMARLVSFGIIAALVLGLTAGFSGLVLMRALDATFSAANGGNEPGISRPLTPLRSGGPSSLVSWNSLGLEGRAFVSSGPTPRDIQRVTGRRALEPIRVYVGLASAPTVQAEADLALRELKRTGAFHRALLAVALPTGRGSVYATLADPLEYMYDGNTAIASIQYSYLPSWISFLAQRPQARQAGRALFNTVYSYWATLPRDHRPKLVVFGESLGAYGAEAAFSGPADMSARTSGALFVGPPNSTEVWRELTAARVKGSPEWLPSYGDGAVVRFAASAGDLRLPGGGLRHPKVVYLQHASDPVVWWAPSLIWRKPAWLAEPRGPGVPSNMQWYPFVTFWQVSADLIVSNTRAGYGHYYGPEVPTAWAAILHPPGWTSAQTAELTAAAVAGKLP